MPYKKVFSEEVLGILACMADTCGGYIASEHSIEDYRDCFIIPENVSR